MRKWRSIATSAKRGAGGAPDDLTSWDSVSMAIPTGRGTYASVDAYAAESEKTATGEGATSLRYAFAASTTTGTVGYLIGQKIWQVPDDATGGVLTDRTNSRTIGSRPHMTQFGNATICAMGNSTNTIVATGGNFSDLAGAPDAEIALVVAGAVLLLNTDASPDGWAASDVADHTNWSTGESASGRLLQTAGPILAAVAFRDVAYVWKGNSIYRGRYVGGQVKWAWEVVCWHMGMKRSTTSVAKYAVAACKNGMAFLSAGITNDGGFNVHFFDGANPPAKLSRDVSFGHSFNGQNGNFAIFLYDPSSDVLTVTQQSAAPSHWFYNFVDDAWGRSTSGPPVNGVTEQTSRPAIVQGSGFDIAKHYSGSYSFTQPTIWAGGTDKVIKLYPVGTASDYQGITSAFDSARIGRHDAVTNFSRLVPVLYAKERNNGATDDMAATCTLRNERHGGSSRSGTVTLSADRDRFDLTAASANFAEFSLSFPNMYVEIADIDAPMTDAGEE